MTLAEGVINHDKNDIPKRNKTKNKISTKIKKANFPMILLDEINEESPCILLAGDDEKGFILLKKLLILLEKLDINVIDYMLYYI